MLLFVDIFSGDELASDTYKINKLHNGVVYELIGKTVTETTDIDESKLGANASEESPGDAGADPSSVSGVNIVLANRLVETGFKKKEYMKYIRDYMKRVSEKLEEAECAVFKKNIAPFIKEVLDEYDEYQFFMGESMDADGMAMPLKYDGETPKLYIFKHGIKEEKC